MAHKIFTLTLAAALLGCGGTLGSFDEDGTGDAMGDGGDMHADHGPDSPVDMPMDTGSDPTVDSTPDAVLDTAVDPTTDDPMPTCDQDLGDWTPSMMSYDFYPERPDSPASWSVDASDSSDWVTSLSVAGWSGDYDGPWAPGTYTIDAWVSWADCGLCIWYYENCEGGGGCEHYYMADRATLTVSDLDPRTGGSITGTLTDTVLVEVNRDGDALIPDGQSVCIDMLLLDGVFES